MTKLEFEAIKARELSVREGSGPMDAYITAVLKSYEDIPTLLKEVERLEAALDEAIPIIGYTTGLGPQTPHLGSYLKEKEAANADA